MYACVWGGVCVGRVVEGCVEVCVEVCVGGALNKRVNSKRRQQLPKRTTTYTFIARIVTICGRELCPALPSWMFAPRYSLIRPWIACSIKHATVATVIAPL